MSGTNLAEIRDISIETNESDGEFKDRSIPCIDCAHEFIWTAGEQLFFRDKQLENPPKRCKDCKRAKNRRLEAIELSRATGRRHHIEVRANCDSCAIATTVPFYPCQGRPVYCRECFARMNNGQEMANGAGGTI